MISMAAYFMSPRLLPPSFEVHSATDSPSEVMTAVCYTQHGNSSMLVLRNDYPRPQILPHQILVAVHFTSLNPCDYKWRRNPMPSIVAGLLMPKPKIPGNDIAGVVVATGSAVAADRFKVGDRVAAMLPLLGSKWGSCAQFVAVSAEFVAHVPDVVSLDHAAAMPLVALTALQGLEKLKMPVVGKTILVQAGAGGVGSFAVQWAKRILGMRVVTTSSARNVDWLRSMGADQVVDYKRHDFDKELRDMDAILDPMSYKYERRSFASPVLRERGGHYLNILGSDFTVAYHGFEDANSIDTPWNWIKFRVKGILSPDSQRYDVITVNPNGAQLQAVLDQMAAGNIKAVIDRTFPLEKAAEAYDLLEEGHTRGKILLEIKHSMPK